MPYSTEFTKGLMLVIFVADKMRQGEYEFVPTRRIAEVLGLALPTTAKILRALRGVGIIEAREGQGGGVRLGRSADKITVLSVLDATESGKKLFRNDFMVQATGLRPQRAQELGAALCAEAENAMRQTLDSKTIAELLAEMSQ